MLKYYQDPNAKCPSAHRAQIMKNLEPWSGFSQIYRVRLSLTVSQSSFSMSTKILISSGMAMAGWVSFSWMATWKTWNPAVKQRSRSYWCHTNRGDCCTRWRSVILLLCCKLSASQLLCFSFSSINDWIWKFTFSGKLSKEVLPGTPFLVVLKRRMMSWSVAATTKYSCFSRSSFPSKNYRTQRPQRQKRPWFKYKRMFSRDNNNVCFRTKY